ncbi:carbohydrate ABC transporter permease [Nesterenkonia sp. CF4.4]|uniref:carbohydrate ABC transporter permease n=1 Tax=Nesterenkonia sp. CF4.4 TaxID=3373079 RepID=UPI003EE57AC9
MQKVLGDRRAILFLLGPALLVYSAIMLIPILWSTGYTFFEGNAIIGFEFTGLSNFQTFFTDDRAIDALWFTVKYAAVVTVGQVVVGYGLAVLYFFHLKRASALIRTLFFFPIVLPTVAVALLFQQLFAIAPRQGIVNEFLNVIGMDSIDWFGSPGTAFFVVALMDIWRSMGFYAVLLYSGLIDIPEEVIESSRIDGAGGWKMIRFMVIPMSLPVLISAIIFSVNGTLKVFDSIIALTGGGPGTTTSPLTLYMFQTSFTNGAYGYGSTIALMLSILCLLVTLVIFRSVRRDLGK